MQRMNTVFWSADTGLAPFFHGECCMDSKNTAQQNPNNFWLVSLLHSRLCLLGVFQRKKFSILPLAAIAACRAQRR
jgi:hypothetical protein